MQIKTLLTRPAITIEPATPLRDARALMRRRGIRHLPVVDHHRLMGMLAERDIERADVSSIPEIARHDWAAAVAGLVVADVMARDPLALHPETPVAEAARLARDRRAGAVAGGDEGAGTGGGSPSDPLPGLGGPPAPRGPPRVRHLLPPPSPRPRRRRPPGEAAPPTGAPRRAAN